jgi:hypothetical protein
MLKREGRKEMLKTIHEIQEEYYSLPDNKKVNILHEALIIMNGYNNQSPMRCIAQAMNYVNNIGDWNTWEKKESNTLKD